MILKLIIKVSFVLLSIVLSTPLFGCLNMYRTNIDGEVIYDEYIHGALRPEKIDSEFAIEIAGEFLSQYKKSGDLEYYSDYGAQLIYAGKYKDAISVFEKIESLKGDLYATAANIGTAYELIGEIDSALYWIKRAIEIDPNSHDKSEWIHIKILEWKKENGLDSLSILGLDFGNKNIPSNPMNYNLEELRDAITFQLYERLQFVEAPNKIVGNIYFDYGNVLAQIRNIEAAIEAYEEARFFGFSNSILENRLGRMKEMINSAELNQKIKDKTPIVKHIGFQPFLKLLIIIGLVIITIITVFIVRRLR